MSAVQLHSPALPTMRSPNTVGCDEINESVKNGLANACESTCGGTQAPFSYRLMQHVSGLSAAVKQPRRCSSSRKPFSSGGSGSITAGSTRLYLTSAP